MSLKVDKVQLEIIMKADSARAEMLKLDGDAKNIEKSMKGLSKTSAEYIQKQEDLTKVRQRMAELRNQIGLAGMTMKELQNRAKELNLQLRNLDPRSPRYAEFRTELERVNGRMRELRGGALQTQSSLSNLANGFNKYFALGAAAVASITGLSMTFRKLAEDVANLDDVYSDVMKTTGMTRDEVVSLNEELKKFDTRTSRESLNNLARDAGKLGITGRKNLLDFVDAGNQINVALGEDLGDDAIKNIGKMVNVYRSSTEQLKGVGLKEQMLSVGSAINELGASSTASEPYLVAFAGRLGGISKQAKISMADILGFASSLDQDMQAVEMSATALQNFIMKLMAEPAKFAKLAGLEVGAFTDLLQNDTNAAIKQVLRSLNEKGGFQALIPIFQDMGMDGARASAVLSSMAGSIDQINTAQQVANQAMAEGTSITTEYSIKNNNLAAQLDKAKKAFQEQALELGQSLNPLLLKSTNGTTYLIKALIALPKVVSENKVTLGALAAILIAYTVAVYGSIVADKLKVLWTEKITVAFTRLTAAVRANPWAAIATGVVLGLTWLNKYLNKQREVNKEQETFNQLAQQSQEIMGNTRSLEDRAKVMKSLSKDQLESLKSDIENQMGELSKFDAQIKTSATKSLETDAELARIRKNIATAETDDKKAFLATQLKHREDAILKELGMEFVKNNKSKRDLQKHITEIDALLKNKNKTTPDTPAGTGDIGKAAKVDPFDEEIKKLESDNKKWQLKIMELRREEKITQEIYDMEAIESQLRFLQAKRDLEIKYSKDTVDTDISISNLRKNSQKASDDAMLTQLSTFNDNALTAIDSAERSKLNMLEDAQRTGLITEKQFNIERRKLETEVANSKLQLALTTLKTIETAEFQSEEERTKAIVKYKEQIDKLKQELRNAGIALENEQITDAVDIDALMQGVFGSSFAKVGDMFANFSTSLRDLRNGDLESWSDWGAAIGGIVQSALSVATEISDQYFDYRFNALEADKQRELTLAGDSKEEREKIEKDYAQKELDLKKKQSSADTVLKIAQVGTAAALAVMQAFAQLGPIGGAIAAVLLGTMTGFQIASILKHNAAIQSTTLDSSAAGGADAGASMGSGARVAQAADGRYDVIGAQDNQLYKNVSYRGNARTGLVTTPTLYGERGTELVIDAPTLRRLNTKVPNFNNFVMANRVNQRADGNYAPIGSADGGADSSYLMQALVPLFEKNNELLEYFKKYGIEAFVLYDKMQREHRVYEESMKKGSKK